MILGAPENGFLAIVLPYRRKLLVERRRPLANYVEPALHERISRQRQTIPAPGYAADWRPKISSLHLGHSNLAGELAINAKGKTP